MPLMLITAVATLFMEAQVGPTVLDHFGFIHFFSFLVLFSVPASFIAIRKGDIRGHRGSMMGVYIGGILIAGSLAFTPGRMLHAWLFG